MPMLRVDQFLCCMKLETGGLVIGWFNAVFDVVGFVMGAFFLVIACVLNCDDVRTTLSNDDDAYKTFDKYEMQKLCNIGQGAIIGAALFIVAISTGFFVIAFFCIRGTNRRNHFHIKPMMVLMAIITVLSFLQILQMNGKSAISGAIRCIFYGYQFIVTYSLYCKFRDEFQRSPAVHYQPPSEKV